MGFGLSKQCSETFDSAVAICNRRSSDECRQAHGNASEIGDVTRTAGHDPEGEMTNSGGFLDSLDAMEDILRSLLDLKERSVSS